MTDEEIANRAAAALVHLVGSRTEIIFGRPLYRNRDPQWEGGSSILFVPFGGAAEAALEAEKFRKLLADEFVAAIHEARRQLPLDVEFGNEVIPELLKDWDKWGDRTSPSKVRALVARMRERIDHLEKMLAFVMVDQEGERAAELLAMAKECGRLDGVREGYDQGYNEATGAK